MARRELMLSPAVRVFRVRSRSASADTGRGAVGATAVADIICPSVGLCKELLAGYILKLYSKLSIRLGRGVIVLIIGLR